MTLGEPVTPAAGKNEHQPQARATGTPATVPVPASGTARLFCGSARLCSDIPGRRLCRPPACLLWVNFEKSRSQRRQQPNPSRARVGYGSGATALRPDFGGMHGSAGIQGQLTAGLSSLVILFCRSLVTVKPPVARRTTHAFTVHCACEDRIIGFILVSPSPRTTRDWGSFLFTKRNCSLTFPADAAECVCIGTNKRTSMSFLSRWLARSSPPNVSGGTTYSLARPVAISKTVFSLPDLLFVPARSM